MTLAEMLKTLKRDILRYQQQDIQESFFHLTLSNIYRHPSLTGVIYYRVGQWLYENRDRTIHFLLLRLYYLFYPLVRMYSGMELSPRTKIGAGLCVMHFGPIVIHPEVMAGENLTLLHRVTLGYAKSGLPRIGDNVSIGVGATIIGGVSIGDNVSIGAGSVVTKDIPANCTAVGIPAKPIVASWDTNDGNFEHSLHLALLTSSEVWQKEHR